MSVDASYATAAQYRAVINATDSGKDPEIENDLAAVSRYIDGKLMRFFGKDNGPIARIYEIQENQKSFWLDDISGVPIAVRMDLDCDGVFETTLESTDFELLPLNADKGPEPRPFMSIRMTPWGKYGSFKAGARVEVTAKFGWPAVPKAIERAAIHLTAIVRLETPRATRRIPDLGESIEASPDAMSIIRQLMDRYKRVKYL